MQKRVSCSHSSKLVPAAIREFAKASRADWQVGVPIGELLTRINVVAIVLVGVEDSTKSVTGRVKPIFTERSFRHYQTLGCIDAPERSGKQAVYCFRHFVQALLVRRLLWERMAAERIVALMAGRSTAETKNMFIEGVEIIARQDGSEVKSTQWAESGMFGVWKRITVMTGIELHVNQDLPKPRPAELRKIIESLETALRSNL